MSARPRPSMRTLSRRIRCRTSFLVTRAVGRRDLLLAAGELLGELALDGLLDLVEPALALLLAGDRAVPRRGRRSTRPRRRRRRRPGSPGRAGTPRSAWRPSRRPAAARVHSVAMNGLAASRPAATTSSVGAPCALVLDEVPRRLGGLGLDHHDRDIVAAVLRRDDPAGDDHVEDGALELAVPRERDPLAVDERDPDAADRAAERQAGELGGHRGAVDRDDVVQVVRVQRQDRDDDLDLVAQALDERRAQRPVDQPAGEDRVRARAGPRGGRTSRGSDPRRTSAPRRRPSAGRSRTGPWGSCRPSVVDRSIDSPSR